MSTLCVLKENRYDKMFHIKLCQKFMLKRTYNKSRALLNYGFERPYIVIEFEKVFWIWIQERIRCLKAKMMQLSYQKLTFIFVNWKIYNGLTQNCSDELIYTLASIDTLQNHALEICHFTAIVRAKSLYKIPPFILFSSFCNATLILIRA